MTCKCVWNWSLLEIIVVTEFDREFLTLIYPIPSNFKLRKLTLVFENKFMGRICTNMSEMVKKQSDSLKPHCLRIKFEIHDSEIRIWQCINLRMFVQRAEIKHNFRKFIIEFKKINFRSTYPNYDWVKRTKFLSAVKYGSPRRHSNSSKTFKNKSEKLKYIFITILGLAEPFKTMKWLDPTQPCPVRPNRNGLWLLISLKVEEIEA